VTAADLAKFQRQELTILFANGRPLTAPLAHWVGALLTTLTQEQMNRVVEKLDHYRDRPPLQKARLTLPPGLDDMQEIANG